MSKSAKNRTLRLFLYLRSAGQTPDLRAANYHELAARLYKQYVELPPEMRRNSLSLGRKIIQACGLRAAYQPAGGVTPFKPVLNPRAKCSICRVKNLKNPKSVWPTKEDAEEFCRYFVRFFPYPCPVGNGWHVAHGRREASPSENKMLFCRRRCYVESLGSPVPVRRREGTFRAR